MKQSDTRAFVTVGGDSDTGKVLLETNAALALTPDFARFLAGLLVDQANAMERKNDR